MKSDSTIIVVHLRYSNGMQTDVVVMITWVRTRTTGGVVFPPLIRPFLRDFMAATVVVDEPMLKHISMCTNDELFKIATIIEYASSDGLFTAGSEMFCAAY